MINAKHTSRTLHVSQHKTDLGYAVCDEIGITAAVAKAKGE